MNQLLLPRRPQARPLPHRRASPPGPPRGPRLGRRQGLHPLWAEGGVQSPGGGFYKVCRGETDLTSISITE